MSKRLYPHRADLALVDFVLVLLRWAWLVSEVEQLPITIDIALSELFIQN